MVKPLASVDTVVQVWDGAQYVSLYGQRDATLDPTMETYELKHKTAGRWINRAAGYRDWGMDCDGLMFMADDDTWHASWQLCSTPGRAMSMMPGCWCRCTSREVRLRQVMST